MAPGGLVLSKIHILSSIKKSNYSSVVDITSIFHLTNTHDHVGLFHELLKIVMIKCVIITLSYTKKSNKVTQISNPANLVC